MSDDFSKDDNYNNINNYFSYLMNKHYPKKEIRLNKYKHKKQDWMTHGILRSIRERDKLFHKCKL